MEKGNWKVYIMLALTTAIWGSAFLAGNIATKELSPITVAFLRFFFAALILFPIMWKWDPKPPKIGAKDWGLFILLGLTGIFLYNVFFFIATKYLPIIKSSLFIATNPVVITLLSGLFLKEVISRRQITGLIFAVFGGFYIIINGNLESFFTFGFTQMDLVLLGAVLSWALYTVLGKVALKKFSSIVSTTYAVGFGTLFLLPFAIMETSWSDIASATIPTWLSIFDLAVLVTVVSFVTWYEGVKRVGAAKAAVFINVMPISAVLMAILFNGESFTIHHLLGAVTIIAGVYISSSTGKNAHQQRNTAPLDQK